MLDCYDITERSADGTIVWIETEDRDGVLSITDPVKEIIGKAKELNLGRVFGILFGPAEFRPLYHEAFAYGVDTLYHFRTKGIDMHSVKDHAEAFAEVSDRVHPMLMMISSTQKGKELTASVSDTLDLNVNECTDLRWIGKAFVCIDGVSENEIRGRPPVLISLISGSLPMPEKEEGRKGTAVIRTFP